MILLTQDSTFLIGQVAWLLGKIMNGIFIVIDKLGVPNIGLAIILFTIIVNLLMLPLTIKQQKFSKLSAKMQPEMQEIQKKYKNKKDQDSQMAMSQEMQEVYAKYGVSPTGSCGYMLIQMPILFALYRVIYAIPAYVTKIGNTFNELAIRIVTADQGNFIINNDKKSIAAMVSYYNKNLGKDTTKGIVDILNRLSSNDLATVAEHYGLKDVTYMGDRILSGNGVRGLIDTYNNFLGLNIGNSPQDIIVNAYEYKEWFLIIGAIMIPVLAALTQWINVKLIPQQPSSGNEQADSMAASMKTMNMVMPIFSAWLCFSMPAGMGLYWVAGSVVRSIQQVLINKHIDKMDFDEIINQNKEKSAKKIEKMRQNQEKMNAYANMQSKVNTRSSMSDAEREEMVRKTTEYYKNSDGNSGSMMSKANMVRKYNEKNNK